MYEDRTYEKLMEESLEIGKQYNVDIRQGSVYFDAEAGNCAICARMYSDLAYNQRQSHPATAEGEYLSEFGNEYNLPRIAETCARYFFVYEGTRPPVGSRFFAADNMFFSLQADEFDQLYLVAEKSGTAYNYIEPGTPAIPVTSIHGLTAASFGAVKETAVDEETDENLRRRIQELLSTPSENGNKAHYKTWCESIEGVGRARILPLWAGKNTVKAVLFGVDGLPAPADVVKRVQDAIDPGGTGLGEGLANIGAYFTAVPATGVDITVQFVGYFVEGADAVQAKEQAEEAVKAFFAKTALDTMDNEKSTVVRINELGSVIMDLAAMLDFVDLTMNGAARNIEIDNVSTPVLTEVIVLTGVTGILMNVQTATLNVEETQELHPIFTPAQATNQNVVWSSTDDAVAAVDDSGLVTALKVGIATIKAVSEDGGYVASCVVTVVDGGE